jgi:peptide/nickel transport system permease protein
MAVVDAVPALAPPDEAGRSGGLARNLEILLPAAALAIIGAACFLGPLVLPVPPPIGGSVLESYLDAGSPGHLLGTDPNGNDIFSRILHGGRSSLVVAIAVNVLGLVVGGTLGALSGYLGGAVDTVIMRVLDVLIAFPSLVLTLAVAQSLGASQTNTILALAFFAVPAFARISRVGMGIVMVIEGALSFLGLGIPPPAPSWGNMIAQGQQSLSATPMLVVWPCAALFVTVLAFNLLGETLRARWSGR